MTTIDPTFLRAIVVMTAFRPDRMRRVQAALLYLAASGSEFTGAELPAELTVRDDGTPDTHIAGAACGALASMELIVVCGRVKSPNVSAKGRKLNLWRAGSIGRIKAWLNANGFPAPENKQMELLAA